MLHLSLLLSLLATDAKPRDFDTEAIVSLCAAKVTVQCRSSTAPYPVYVEQTVLRQVQLQPQPIQQIIWQPPSRLNYRYAQPYTTFSPNTVTKFYGGYCFSGRG